MRIILFSFTGNCRRFLNMTNIPKENIVELSEIREIFEEFILITPTIGFGEVPPQVEEFLNRNHDYARGVIASGNRNWGKNFANAANIINEKYGIPILMKIELLGNKEDINNFEKIYMEMRNDERV